jgi:uncharacterized membrane protein/protein-disulfide isomerase
MTKSDAPRPDEAAMTTHRAHLTRLLALTALVVSTALLWNGLRLNPRFCPFGGGCEEVLSSAYGRPLGVPLPLVGVLTFGSLFAASLLPGRRVGRALGLLAPAAGAGGLVLILLQVFVLRRVCPFCLIVDACAVTLAVVELSWGRGRPLPAVGGRARSLWLAAAPVLAGGAAALVSTGSGGAAPAPGPVPAAVAALWVPGKVNVVEVADFQCPHCRRMHEVLALFLDEEGDRVHFARLTAPLPAHVQARHASRAFLCAEQQGRGDEMAELLFHAADLRPEACERLAAALGLSLPAFRACVTDPRTDHQIDADLAWMRAASPQGLPVIWVQDRMLFGEQPIAALRAAARAAEAASPP